MTTVLHNLHLHFLKIEKFSNTVANKRRTKYMLILITVHDKQITHQIDFHKKKHN